MILSREEYNSLEETAYLLRPPANAKRLLEALACPLSAFLSIAWTRCAMNLTYDPDALEDLRCWRRYNKKKLAKIIPLLEEISSAPFAGKGKPEPLKYVFPGCGSRRIDKEHRLVYSVEGDTIAMLSCRDHIEESEASSLRPARSGCACADTP